MAGVTGVTGVTGLPEGDGRTLVCRWSTGIPASHLPPATCSSQRHANSKRANQTLCCLGLAKLPCTFCTVRTTHCTLGTHCTLHWIINCLPTWQAGWLAGWHLTVTTHSLTTHHSPSTIHYSPSHAESYKFSLPSRCCCSAAIPHTDELLRTLSLYSLLHPHPRTQPLGSSQRTSYPARSS